MRGIVIIFLLVAGLVRADGTLWFFNATTDAVTFTMTPSVDWTPRSTLVPPGQSAVIAVPNDGTNGFHLIAVPWADRETRDNYITLSAGNSMEAVLYLRPAGDPTYNAIATHEVTATDAGHFETPWKSPGSGGAVSDPPGLVWLCLVAGVMFGWVLLTPLES